MNARKGSGDIGCLVSGFIFIVLAAVTGDIVESIIGAFVAGCIIGACSSK